MSAQASAIIDRKIPESRRHGAFAKSLVAALFLGATLFTAGGASAEAEKPKIVDHYFPGSIVSLMDYVAKAEGFFGKRGVDVELLPIPSGPQALAAALGGTVNIFNSARTLTDPVTSKGECIQYVSAGARSLLTVIARPGLALPNKDKPYPAPLLDLKGAKIGIVALGSASETRMNIILADAGLKPGDVTYIGVGGLDTSIAAFSQGEIDFLQAFPPMETLLGKDGFQRVASQIGERPDNPLSSMIFGGQAVTCEFAEQHPEAVLGYCRAIWDSFDFANDPANKAAMVSHIGELLSLDESQAAGVWETAKGAYPSARLSKEDWLAQSRYGSEQFKDYQPDYDTYVHSCLKSDPR